jgi:Ricin-type beta-trefoil lectin domain-like
VERHRKHHLHWQFVALGSGWYRLNNRTTGLVADSYGNTTAGAPAQQAPWNGSVNAQRR